MKPIYFDYAATTPVDPRVAEKMMDCLTMDGNFGNPASRSHLFGWQAEEAVEMARVNVAKLINAEPREIVWTSGATESTNLALKGAAHAYADKGKHIVTSKIEHKATLDTCAQLEQVGFSVTYLEPDSDGTISVDKVTAALREDTILVSLMHANNEIGVITDIAAIGAVTRPRNILLHVDAAQSVGKIPVDIDAFNIDLMSISAHKMYGPKGIGVLYVRRMPKIKLEAQIHGGGHERGMRSGTLPTHQIVGMGVAADVAMTDMTEETRRIQGLRDRLLAGISQIDCVHLNGRLDQRLPNNINIGFEFVEGESLLMALKDLAVSSGSACNSATVAPSYVLTALGISDELAHSSVRFSLGRYSTEEEVDQALGLIEHAVSRLRQLSPAWKKRQAQAS